MLTTYVPQTFYDSLKSPSMELKFYILRGASNIFESEILIYIIENTVYVYKTFLIFFLVSLNKIISFSAKIIF